VEGSRASEGHMVDDMADAVEVAGHTEAHMAALRAGQGWDGTDLEGAVVLAEEVEAAVDRNLAVGEHVMEAAHSV
jgi:hypothetical protein